MRVSVIVPTLNEEACIARTLTGIMRLQPFETIVADGGSNDGTVAIAHQHCRVLQTPKGRGEQQRLAAQIATGDVIWFLHADSIPAEDSLDAINTCLRDDRVAGGNFSLCFDGDGRSSKQLTAMYPWLRLLGLCYGDSGIFVRRTAYDALGGINPYPLFEDVDLVRRVRAVGEFRRLPQKIVTSSRRFEHRNFAMMFAEWSSLQLLYWAGVSPYRLARWYAPVRKGAGT